MPAIEVLAIDCCCMRVILKGNDTIECHTIPFNMVGPSCQCFVITPPVNLQITACELAKHRI